MAEIIILELPEPLAQRVKEVAAFKQQRVEDVLIEWINVVVTDLPLESLPDEEVLALCDLQMQTEQQEIFSELLARNQEGQLTKTEISQLDKLMQIYRKGLVRKAQALKIAVERGLKPALGT